MIASRFGCPKFTAAAFVCLITSVLTQAFCAQDGESGKEPYSMFYFAGGGGIFSPQHSSATAPTAPCPNGEITNLNKACAEQFSQAGSGLIEMGARPIRYLQASTTIGILGNFNGYSSFTAPYQCVSGCTGTTSVTFNTTSALVTIDALAVLPLFHEHLLISAGGGPGWIAIRTHQQTPNAQLEGLPYNFPSPQGGHGPTEVAEITRAALPLSGLRW